VGGGVWGRTELPHSSFISRVVTFYATAFGLRFASYIFFFLQAIPEDWIFRTHAAETVLRLAIKISS